MGVVIKQTKGHEKSKFKICEYNTLPFGYLNSAKPELVISMDAWGSVEKTKPVIILQVAQLDNNLFLFEYEELEESK